MAFGDDMIKTGLSHCHDEEDIRMTDECTSHTDCSRWLLLRDGLGPREESIVARGLWPAAPRAVTKTSGTCTATSRWDPPTPPTPW